MSVTPEGTSCSFPTSTTLRSARSDSDFYVIPRNQPISLGLHTQTSAKKAGSAAPSTVTKPFLKHTASSPDSCRSLELSAEATTLLRKFPALSETSDLLKSARFLKVLQYLTQGGDAGDKTDELVKMFEQISLREYNAITLLLETNVLKRSQAIERLPYDGMLIRPSVEMNLSLKSSCGEFDATPDIAILLARQSGLHLDPQLEISAHPEIIMVMMIIITEDTPYHSPKEGSTAWHTFCHHTKCSSFSQFLGMMETTDGDDRALGPVTVANHSWTRITQVDYYVWTLFPQVDMQAVDVMIGEGLVKIRDAIIRFSRQLDPNTDTDSLAEANFRWDFDWQRCQISIANGAECTAHERFQDWYADAFRAPSVLSMMSIRLATTSIPLPCLALALWDPHWPPSPRNQPTCPHRARSRRAAEEARSKQITVVLPDRFADLMVSDVNNDATAK
ncbi:hypothetical protein BU15DRAFT_73466 [Melanogaster broomeanus]|nr:hypothetical protein BU15DRAFT_73466 [Melanogaster broomeanus]